MRVKRFTAADITEALRQVRRELGPEAVILSTGRLPQGGVEVSAAVEPPAGAGETADPSPRQDPAGDTVSLLARRLEDLSGMLGRHLVAAEAATGFAARPEVAPLYHCLKEQELDPRIMARLLDGLSAPDGVGLLPRLYIRFKKMLHTGYPLRLTPGRPVVWALVGPTGVGKTTTVAKLAARFSLKQGLKVGMISADAYRMAAAEQLAVYGRIMEVPTREAGDPGQMRRALDELGDRDLVLVDTVGRSPGDQGSLEELQGLLKAVPHLENHLVLACPTRDRDQARVVDAFRAFAPRSLIFTKLDETGTLGPLVNQVVRTGLPLSYITCGQKVPDDLEEADRDRLAKRILPSRRAVDRLAGFVS